MTILEWIAATVFVGVITMLALLIVVSILFVLIGAFAKGYDTTREKIIHQRYRK